MKFEEMSTTGETWEGCVEWFCRGTNDQENVQACFNVEHTFHWLTNQSLAHSYQRSRNSFAKALWVFYAFYLTQRSFCFC